MKHLTILILSAAVLVVPLTGCSTIAEKLADELAGAIQPQLERLVDSQIEREEKALGIWGTTNSFFYIQAEAAKAEEAAQEEARKEEVLSAVVEMISKNQDALLAEAEKLVEKKLGGK